MKTKIGKSPLALMILILLSFSVKAQQRTPPTIYVGDKVPELRYGKWFKGTPIKEFKKGHLYIYEFWATWCGPCIASMPHLSDVARNNANDLTIVAVDVWEDLHGKSTYAEKQQKVSKFIKTMGKNMDFNVIIDTEDEFMGKNWMTAAGQGGIPTSMMVKDGIIQWMGHPINLDSIVTLVMSGKYDVATARKTAVERANRAPSAQQVAIAKVNKQIADEVKAKRYDEASRITDSVTATLSVEQAVVLNWNKFNMLLDFVGEKEAVDFLKKWFSTYSGFRGSAGATLVHKEGLSKETYMFAINMLKPLIDNPQPGSLVYNMIANAYANMGDYKSAVDAQELAIVKAREYLKNEKFIGFVTEDQIKEYQEKILKYKAQIK